MSDTQTTTIKGRRIEVEGVSLHYELRGGTLEALRDVTLEIDAGEFISVIGPSGCGKSTLLFILAGLLTPTSGSVKGDEREVDGPGADRAMVFQHDAVFPWLTVARNVEYGLRMRHVPRKERERIVSDFLELVGLANVRSLYPRELSGGMRKRVDMARAFANEPPVLLMDEPYGSLDAMTKEHLQVELLRIWRRVRNTVCFVTHDLEEALFLSDRIVMLMPRPGRISEIIEVPFERPRPASLKLSQEFQDMRRQLTEALAAISQSQT
jgi:NitT/TauT family transport system ATP-binding protein